MWFELSGDGSPGASILNSVQFRQMSQGGGVMDLSGADMTAVTLNGIEVNRASGTNNGGDPLLVYWWERDGIGYQLLALPEGDLTPELVEDLLLDIFVQFTPTAESESARLEQERTELMPFPIPDTCAVTGWAGPDFRVGQQYASAYFLDGDGLTLGTTHGVLFAGENEVTWLADAPLTTSEALSGPKTIRAVQSDGDGSTVAVPIEVIEQIDGGRRDDSVERAWWSTVSFPSEGCWEISVSLGVHTLTATVYVYPQDTGRVER